MSTKEKRILWICNHATLMQWEVPLLIDLGFEVFVPKKIPSDSAARSSSVSDEFDSSLTIPLKLLNKLNKFDFYNNHWSPGIVKEINNYFGIAFCVTFPILMDNLSELFTGNIFIRAFGQGEGYSYADFFENSCSEFTLDRIIEKRGIWFAHVFKSIIEFEPKWLRDISIYLPIGLPDKYYRQQDQWVYQDKRILFVCPQISTPYYHQVYEDFNNNFSDFPHVICGIQNGLPENDPSVIGYIPEDEYHALMKSCALMYYHSTEKRHLHYHPIEAVIFGMPLVFMAGGVLDDFAGTMLPGSCKTYTEAREKIGRILNNDTVFINEVINGQKLLLEALDYDNLKLEWQNNFLPLAFNEFDQSIKIETKNPDSMVLGV
ncbi:MAG TPA: hypothetical protein VGK38_10230, partial [Prolixibacteraceae bacterium]